LILISFLSLSAFICINRRAWCSAWAQQSRASSSMCRESPSAAARKVAPVVRRQTSGGLTLVHCAQARCGSVLSWWDKSPATQPTSTIISTLSWRRWQCQFGSWWRTSHVQVRVGTTHQGCYSLAAEDNGVGHRDWGEPHQPPKYLLHPQGYQARAAASLRPRRAATAATLHAT
jgi:hypothetical protein